MPWIRTTCAVLWSARSRRARGGPERHGADEAERGGDHRRDEGEHAHPPWGALEGAVDGAARARAAGVDAAGTGRASARRPARRLLRTEPRWPCSCRSSSRSVALVVFVGFVDAARRRPRVTFRRLRPGLRFPHRAQDQGCRPHRLRVGQAAGKSSGLSSRSCAWVGSSTSWSRQACRPMASSRRFRANRPLPKAWVRGVAREDPAEGHLRLAADVVVGRRGELPQDEDQLVVGVVVELDDGLEPAGQTGVLGHEDDHRVGCSPRR